MEWINGSLPHKGEMPTHVHDLLHLVQRAEILAVEELREAGLPRSVDDHIQSAVVLLHILDGSLHVLLVSHLNRKRHITW